MGLIFIETPNIRSKINIDQRIFLSLLCNVSLQHHMCFYWQLINKRDITSSWLLIARRSHTHTHTLMSFVSLIWEWLISFMSSCRPVICLWVNTETLSSSLSLSFMVSWMVSCSFDTIDFAVIKGSDLTLSGTDAGSSGLNVQRCHCNSSCVCFRH